MATYDAMTSPRRGGVRFVDPHTVLGGHQPAVRIIITDPGSPARPAPHGILEANPAPISPESVAVRLCTAGFINIPVDKTGQPLRVGREQRLFTPTQRTALAVRDGVCRWPHCTHPPSWTEAHHLDEWAAEHGNTDTDLAILLCRRHHRLLHDPRQALIPLPSKSTLVLQQFKGPLRW